MRVIFDIPYGRIEMLRELWEKNRRYHEECSEYFKESYRSLQFDERIRFFGGLDPGAVKISVAEEDSECIGYCISTITNGAGEIASLHVEEARRGAGIGKELVRQHIQWMQEKSCTVIGVSVSQENESTIGFYQQLGFYPNTLYMQLK